VGHDEYWSDAMREHVDCFVRGGGNVAFFSGNTCWYRVAFDDETSFRRLHPWFEAGEGRPPENTTTGVSYRNGGERRLQDPLVPFGYRVQHADHWVYEGTGLPEGEVFGGAPDEHLVGYECDGAEFDRGCLADGSPARPTGRDGTPLDFTILGVADVRSGGWGLGNGAATMGVHGDRGTVFTASTTDWARVLTDKPGGPVETVTRNVLDRLGGC
jgi:hypothetical protein